MPDAAKPVPVVDEASQPWFDAAKQRRLLLQRCDDCGTHRFPAWPRCDNCWSTEWSWLESGGTGVIFSWVLMHQVYHPGFAGEVPYPLATIELDEGPWINAALVDAPHDEIKTGMRVEVVFDDVSDDITVPKFRPLRSAPVGGSA